MLLIKAKYLFSAVLCAVMLIAGCDSIKIPDFKIPGGSYDSEPDSVDSSSTEESSQEPDDKEPSYVEPVQSDNVFNLICDPRNELNAKVSGNTITIFGKDTDMNIDGVYLDYGESAAPQKTADGFTCTVSISSNKDRFLNLSIYGDWTYEYRVKYNSSSDTLEFIAPPATAAENSEVVEKATILAPSLVKRYITTDENGDVEKILEEIRTISDQICEDLDNDYDKLRAISRWVSDNIYYDYPAHDAGIPEECLSLEYMLDKHSSVCGGYSNMTSALCAAQGITCYNVKGYALTGDVTYAETSSGEAYHEWNYAVIDGRVIWVDSGWNSHNYYRNSGKYDYNGISYKYFDIGLETFSQDHRCVSAEIRNYYALLED